MGTVLFSKFKLKGEICIMNSYWVETTGTTNYPKVNKDIETEVCIIGGGITGIATAYLLSKESNLDITILEADKMALGVTAKTTAKITSQHGLLYDYLLNSFGKGTMQAYLESNEEAIKLIENIVATENIECDFCKEDAFVYTCEEDNDEKIRKEVEALKTIGFDAEYVTETPLPFKVVSAVKFKNQAQFHSRKYLLSLLKALEKVKVNLYENSKVVDIKHKSGIYEVHVNDCIVRCKYLVLATHYPIKNFPRYAFY